MFLLPDSVLRQTVFKPSTHDAQVYSVQRKLAGLALLSVGVVLCCLPVSLREAGCMVLGVVVGVTLTHADFDVARGLRRLLSDRRGGFLRAHMSMLTVACLMCGPSLLLVRPFGVDIVGRVEPVGVSTLVGSLLFGLGLQLSSVCAMGMLRGVGSGDPSAVLAFVCFTLGCMQGAHHLDLWTAHVPDLAPFSLLSTLGLPVALLIQVFLFAGVALLSVVVELRHHAELEEIVFNSPYGGLRRVFRGKWPPMTGGMILGLVTALTLLLAGTPFGVGSGVTLWGCQLLHSQFGVDVTAWEYWHRSLYATQWVKGWLHDTQSLQAIGVVLGAFLASTLAGRFGGTTPFSLRAFIAVALGGSLMGYGSRVSYGDNTEAAFAGIASFSAHGWLWLCGCLIGCYIGVYARPLFGLSVEGDFRDGEKSQPYLQLEVASDDDELELGFRP